MPDGSPIDQWWKSHRSARSVSQAKAMHVFDVRIGRAACGRRPAAKMYALPPDGEVTCADCQAVMRSAPERMST